MTTTLALNADFGVRAAMHTAVMPWVPSPAAGVERKMLDRVGGEVARATSLVRYAAGSRFAPHVHGGGEEFLVLEGVFQDELGDYPAGFYVRNPPTSSHRPGAADGCIILVKLWQFDATDRESVRLDTSRGSYTPAAGRPGVARMALYRGFGEEVALERWDPGAALRLDAAGGTELLVLDGGFSAAGESFERQAWLRLPVAMPLIARAGPSGCRVWLKTGHLAGLSESVVRQRLAAAL